MQQKKLVKILGEFDLTGLTANVNMATLTALEEIRVKPNTIFVGFNIVTSGSLSAESGKSILLGLANFTGTENAFTKTVAFHANVWRLLEAEGATAPGDMTWADYVWSKGWNK